LPFEHDAFDFVHSSAVLEHVGSREQQARFLREAWRVARKGIFIATPDRRFPIEFHTLLPVIHWLPMRLYRRLLNAIGYYFFADESNLNLMSRRALARAARAAGIERFEIRSVSLLALPTNLMLMARKTT
jgi:ubiquinone/menaquinone biosynthesis C-methylase UbiE